MRAALRGAVGRIGRCVRALRHGRVEGLAERRECRVPIVRRLRQDLHVPPERDAHLLVGVRGAALAVVQRSEQRRRERLVNVEHIVARLQVALEARDRLERQQLGRRQRHVRAAARAAVPRRLAAVVRRRDNGVLQCDRRHGVRVKEGLGRGDPLGGRGRILHDALENERELRGRERVAQRGDEPRRPLEVDAHLVHQRLRQRVVLELRGEIHGGHRHVVRQRRRRAVVGGRVRGRGRDAQHTELVARQLRRQFVERRQRDVNAERGALALAARLVAEADAQKVDARRVRQLVERARLLLLDALAQRRQNLVLVLGVRVRQALVLAAHVGRVERQHGKAHGGRGRRRLGLGAQQQLLLVEADLGQLRGG